MDQEGRYPQVENTIPTLGKNVTTCRLTAEDAAFLVQALPRLPGGKEQHNPVTLDLTDQVVVRARGEGQTRTTEVVLSRSEVSGPAVRLVGNRQHLARAVQLGLTEFKVANADTPVVCRDNRRTYVWMPLAKDMCLSPSADALRIASDPHEKPTRSSTKERRPTAMPAPTTNGSRHGGARRAQEDDDLALAANSNNNGHSAPRRAQRNEEHAPALSGGNGHAAPRRTALNGDLTPTTQDSIASVLQEAEALKELLRDAYGRMTRLLAALKRQRQQSKLLKSTLSSLRQLQQIDA